MSKRIDRKACSILVLFLCAAIFFGGCNMNFETENKISKNYIEIAQNFIDDGDYDSALSVLKQGYALTKDPQIGAMIADVLLLEPAATSSNVLSTTEATISAFDYSAFNGIWAEESVGLGEGGMIMEFNADEHTIIIKLSHAFSVDSMLNASTRIEFDVSSIEDTLLESDFTDSYGNTGRVSISLAEKDVVQCTISEFVGAYKAYWGLFGGVYTLYRNDHAYDNMNRTDGDNTPIATEPLPANNNITASDILADRNMTEESFRASCKELVAARVIIHSSGKIVYPENYFGLLRENPNQYVGEHYVIREENEFDFHCDIKDIDSNGYIYYCDTDEDVIIVDLRDDPLSPNILEGENITPYVIFTGVELLNGTDYLVFAMISFDYE